MINFRFLPLLFVTLLLGACAQQDDSAPQNAADASSSPLDMSLGPNKVTADDYRHEPVPVVIRDSVPSVDADGNVAPFGMASRAEREVAPAAAAAVAATTSAVAGGQPAVYTAQCAACHGADAKGVEGLGLDLVASQLVADSSVDELVAFLKAGRMPGSPDSVTGIPMPAFAWLPQADLDAVASYLKSL